MDREPPEPPDPSDGDLSPLQMELSPPIFTLNATKRRLDIDDESQPEPSKKTITEQPDHTPSVSIQSSDSKTIYTHPLLSEMPKMYLQHDKGPFIVHISRQETTPSSGTTIRPIIFGQFLKKNNINNIVEGGIKKIGRNRISVEFKTGKDANEFIKNSVLSLYKYEAVIPNYNVTRLGLVRGIPTELTMEELVEAMTTPDHCGVVLKARRLNRKQVENGVPSWIPTQTVVLTFLGQCLPTRIFLYYTSIIVEAYQLPTIQCNNCCRFGHIKTQCRSQPRCYRCAQSHPGENCTVTADKATCLHCSGTHFATNRNCLEHSRQKSIKIRMTQDNISFQEAAALFPSVKRSFAEVSNVSNTSSSSYSAKQTASTSLSQSYRKTVFTTPRRPSSLGKSFDREAHNNIIRNCPSTLPNGCALDSSSNTEDDSPNDECLDLLWLLVINILKKFSDVPIPPNVAPKILPLLSLLTKHGPENCSVE